MSSVSPPASPKPPSTMPGTGPLRTNLRISARPTASTPMPPSLQAKLNAMMANRNVGAAAASSFRHMTPRRAPPPRLSGMSLGTFQGPPVGSPANGLGLGRPCSDFTETPFSRLSNIVDASGVLRFRNTTLDSTGVRFSDGQTFSINMSELELREDVGRGVFGTVKRVLHRPTNAVLAMKEIRLELDDAKLNTIVMELNVLHRAVSPDIIDFYGGFFVEGCVYYCIEYMDAGSMDRIMLAYPGVPEPMLAYVLLSVVRGLKFLKDVLHIMHRDVKPTNVLMNTKGQVKLCDFGVSGQLEKSLARTHVGAQSYMAPERIDAGALGGNAGVLIGGSADAYTTAADVWSLGVTALEIARGAFPYAFDPKASALAQLIAIVDGPPPELPAEDFSTEARDWVQRCLQKLPDRRATYAELLDHPFLRNQTVQQADASAWVNEALSRLSAGNIVGSSSP